MDALHSPNEARFNQTFVLARYNTDHSDPEGTILYQAG